MYTNSSQDNKFGLPKPDFKNLPKKRAIWPVVVFVLLFVCFAKIIYEGVWLKSFVKQQGPLEDFLVTQQVNGKEKAGVGARIDVEVNESVSREEAFKGKKNGKKTDNLEAVRQWLNKEPSHAYALVKSGSYQALYEPQGVYHLVVVSHLRKEAAMHSVQQLIKKNLGVCLIVPRSGERYYRVTIAHSRTFYEADLNLKRLRPEYKNLFILKY
ncbi:MAG: hypothetical protein K2X94_00265 [Amoebophilaceae bacterium]|nr:hypothetical protein [Amoebophilaceae bacterium]